MDSYVSLEDQIWFLRVYHHIQFSLYLLVDTIFSAFSFNVHPSEREARIHIRETKRWKFGSRIFNTKEHTVNCMYHLMNFKQNPYFDHRVPLYIPYNSHNK